VSKDVNTAHPGPSAWSAASNLLTRWLARRDRIDRLMEQLPSGLTPAERARCQHLVYGVVRHAGRIEAALDRLIAHPPRFPVRAMLYLLAFELIEDGRDEGRAARIVHHAVGQAKTLASAAEGKLVNAVGRRLALMLPSQEAPPRGAPAASLAEYYSHPLWLVERWLARFGPAATYALLEWNQQPAPVYVRLRGQPLTDEEIVTYTEGECVLRPTRWAGFHELSPGQWPALEPLLRTGRVYVQDPSARHAVELLAPQPGETVLDACASPGGKSLLIADRMGSGTLAALDFPGERVTRLRENLAHIHGVATILVPADLEKDAPAALAGHGLPASFAAVLLDAPCSNSGVMRHRIDVKWRLEPGDFVQHGRQQLSLLQAAARLVAPGGRLVYSTCSLDPEENEGVVAAFLARAGGAFTLDAQTLSRPWEAHHDGAGAFLLRARTPPPGP
jgi:16S rRNA (cytosine967-C5)-methyltransferase